MPQALARSPNWTRTFHDTRRTLIGHILDADQHHGQDTAVAAQDGACAASTTSVLWFCGSCLLGRGRGNCDLDYIGEREIGSHLFLNDFGG
jgi:hypothetical protein